MKKEKPKLIVQFDENSKVNFPEFVGEVLGYIKSGQIPKNYENKKSEKTVCNKN